ncbi:hypothetical protein QC7_1472 [Clostridioides difficile CD38]|nr:hypothetical protein QC7_1472 [Clostridioides difficile CD38]EQG22169.1 hypothetical protein QIG_1339 [Clostridioides difficile DA00065]EQI01342.1 hypothetical protein QO7_1334 [Clostridioides difficile F314]EQI30001.1 hypothetical protein QOQ_1294 [Clostridioides difficile Y171]EQL08998.1 hypothetical protein QE3_1526 [Clostridioides difficile CD88]
MQKYSLNGKIILIKCNRIVAKIKLNTSDKIFHAIYKINKI